MRCRGIWLVLLAGCGSPTPRAATAGAVAIEPSDFLQELGARSTPVLQPPERSIEELEAARASATGPERRRAIRDLVVAHLFAAEDAETRDARRHRRTAERLADAALRGSRDEQVNAELEFTKVWSSWREGTPAAGRRAERFTTRFRGSGELLMLAWMIRGEVALTTEDYDQAIASFRFALGRLEHPLYAYALLRTARAHREAGRVEEANQALREVEQLGCSTDEPLISRLAQAAAAELGTGTRTDPDGTSRPVSCPVAGTRRAEPEGWRPAE